MHTKALSACTGLTQLVISKATIYDSNDEVYLNSELSLIPAHMELQTQLHTLLLNRAELGANMKWITKLTHLKDLSMCFCFGHNNVIQPVFF